MNTKMERMSSILAIAKAQQAYAKASNEDDIRKSIDVYKFTDSEESDCYTCENLAMLYADGKPIAFGRKEVIEVMAIEEANNPQSSLYDKPLEIAIVSSEYDYNNWSDEDKNFMEKYNCRHINWIDAVEDIAAIAKDAKAIKEKVGRGDVTYHYGCLSSYQWQNIIL